MLGRFLRILRNILGKKYDPYYIECGKTYSLLVEFLANPHTVIWINHRPPQLDEK